jgi:hypothetical protein
MAFYFFKARDHFTNAKEEHFIPEEQNKENWIILGQTISLNT